MVYLHEKKEEYWISLTTEFVEKFVIINLTLQDDKPRIVQSSNSKKTWSFTAYEFKLLDKARSRKWQIQVQRMKKLNKVPFNLQPQIFQYKY